MKLDIYHAVGPVFTNTVPLLVYVCKNCNFPWK